MEQINNLEIGENYIRVIPKMFEKQTPASMPGGIDFKVNQIIVPALSFKTISIKVAGYVARTYHAFGFETIWAQKMWDESLGGFEFFYRANVKELFFRTNAKFKIHQRSTFCFELNGIKFPEYLLFIGETQRRM